MAATGAASMDMYLPALPRVADAFGASAAGTQVTVTTFFVGLAAGHLLAGPLSDWWGRRRPLVAGYVVYVAATVLCAVAPSLAVLVSARFVQGLAAATGMVLSRAIVRDLHAGAAAARQLSLVALAVGSTAALAPLLGALLIGHTSWRGIFAVQVGIGAGLLLAIVARLPETHPPGGRRPGVEPLVRSFGHLLASRPFTGWATVLALSSGAAFTIITASSLVVQDVYGRSPGVFGLVFGCGAGAVVALSLLNVRLLRRVAPARVLRAGLIANALAGAALLATVLAEFGLLPVAVCMVVVFGTWGALVVPNVTALAMADHGSAAGSASALLGIVQFGTGALVAPLAGIGGGDTAVPFAVVVGACGVAAIACFSLLPARG